MVKMVSLSGVVCMVHARVGDAADTMSMVIVMSLVGIVSGTREHRYRGTYVRGTYVRYLGTYLDRRA